MSLRITEDDWGSVQRVVSELDRRTTDEFDESLVDAALSTAAKTIQHKFGRLPRGWQIVDLDADARVWRSGALTRNSITLTASAVCNVTLRFF